MLVLRRRRNEAVVVDGPARIVVLELEGDRVKLGVVAGREVTVLRAELVAPARARLRGPGPSP